MFKIGDTINAYKCEPIKVWYQTDKEEILILKGTVINTLINPVNGNKQYVIECSEGIVLCDEYILSKIQFKMLGYYKSSKLNG